MIQRDREPVAARYLRVWLDPANLYAKKKNLTRYQDDHKWVYADKELPFRLKATERALTKLFLASWEFAGSASEQPATAAERKRRFEALEHQIRMLETRDGHATEHRQPTEA
jgi:hypothetical protein